MAVDIWREIGTICDNLQRFAGMQAYPLDDETTVLVLNLANGVAGDETHARNVRKAIDDLDEPTALVDVNPAVTAGMGPDVFVPWAIVEVHIEQRPNARMEIPLPLSDDGCLRALGLVVDTPLIGLVLPGGGSAMVPVRSVAPVLQSTAARQRVDVDEFAKALASGGNRRSSYNPY